MDKIITRTKQSKEPLQRKETEQKLAPVRVTPEETKPSLEKRGKE